MTSKQRAARREYNRKWYGYAKNRAARRASAKKHYGKHKERRLADMRNQYRKNKQKYRDRDRNYKYGITGDQYRAILASQNGLCAICKTSDPKGRGSFHIDHDHVSGQTRSLLCNSCNVGLGYFRDDSTRLRLAADYVDSYKVYC